MKLQPTPVKVCAQVHNIPVFQPTKLRDGTALETIRQLEPDLIVVAAYGRILPQEILDYPRLGCVNVHSSLLPKYRGRPHPLGHSQRRAGDRRDPDAHGPGAGRGGHHRPAGHPPSTRTRPWRNSTTAWPGWGRTSWQRPCPTWRMAPPPAPPQEESQATLAPMLSRELSPMDFTRPARALHDQVRGLIPWPAAVTELGGVRCKIFATTVLEETTGKAPRHRPPGGQEGAETGLRRGTVLRIDELQADGGKRMASRGLPPGPPHPRQRMNPPKDRKEGTKACLPGKLRCKLWLPWTIKRPGPTAI